VRVRIAKDRDVAAQTYVMRPAGRSALSGEAWDFAAFMRDHRDDFVTRYGGFDRL
jgi:hypothetical protein